MKKVVTIGNKPERTFKSFDEWEKAEAKEADCVKGLKTGSNVYNNKFYGLTK